MDYLKKLDKIIKDKNFTKSWLKNANSLVSKDDSFFSNVLKTLTNSRQSEINEKMASFFLKNTEMVIYQSEIDVFLYEQYLKQSTKLSSDPEAHASRVIHKLENAEVLKTENEIKERYSAYIRQS